VKRWERWTFNGLALAVAASGFVYLWMKYALETDDPFAVVNHPWQPLMLQLHVLASPPFVLIFGVVLNSHVMRKLQATGLRNQRSGYVSLGTFAVMLASGYLLQVATSEALLSALVWAHVSSAALFTLAYATHLLLSLSPARRRTPLARSGVHVPAPGAGPDGLNGMIAAANVTRSPGLRPSRASRDAT
jgi:hypothetical protein